jgi:hypothetical protein
MVPRRFWPNPELDDRSRGKMNSTDIATEETIRSQPRFKDICKLRSPDATSPPDTVYDQQSGDFVVTMR